MFKVKFTVSVLRMSDMLMFGTLQWGGVMLVALEFTCAMMITYYVLVPSARLALPSSLK